VKGAVEREPSFEKNTVGGGGCEYSFEVDQGVEISAEAIRSSRGQPREL